MPISSTFVLLHGPATPPYGFDVSCQGTFPEAIIAFLEADGYEDAVRNAQLQNSPKNSSPFLILDYSLLIYNTMVYG
jgi:hypothetical protein